MKTPKDLFFAESHEWVKFAGDGTALVGISDHAQSKMGDVAFINLCDEGDGFAAGDTLGDIESIKAVSDIYCPVSGIVKRVNDELLDNPALINSKPYESWLVELEDVEQNEELMDAESYDKYCESE